jgi:uncharacterized cupredoxin-like copper-binding protein
VNTPTLKVALLLSALALFVTCGLAQRTVSSARTVTLIMGDIYFQIEGQERGEPLTLNAGEVVTFVIRNEGGMLHNVQFGRDLDAATRRYQAELLPGFAGLDLNAGETARVTLQMPAEPGEWEIGCLVLGHYEAGQLLALILE